MSKINTKIIKKNIESSFGKSDWKRLTKRTFHYNNAYVLNKDKSIMLLNNKLNWRCYRSSDSEPIFVIDDGETILYMDSERSQLPANCYDVGLQYNERIKSFVFFVQLKPEFIDAFDENIEIYEDEIREYDIAGLEAIFQKKGLFVSCEQENTFLLRKITKNKTFELLSDSDSNKERIKNILIDLGFNYSTNMEVF